VARVCSGGKWLWRSPAQGLSRQHREGSIGQTLGNFSRKVTEKGFTYGGGAEYAVSSAVSLRAEFNRTNFSRDLRQNKISLGAAFRF
jgi:outer membrane immunogenic protein